MLLCMHVMLLRLLRCMHVITFINIHIYLIINSVIRGNHIYKDAWDAPIGKALYRETGNHSDPCAVKVNVATLGATTSVVSGHVPCSLR